MIFRWKKTQHTNSTFKCSKINFHMIFFKNSKNKEKKMQDLFRASLMAWHVQTYFFTELGSCISMKDTFDSHIKSFLCKTMMVWNYNILLFAIPFKKQCSYCTVLFVPLSTWYIIQHLPCFLLGYQMDLVDHPDKEILSLQGFSKERKISWGTNKFTKDRKQKLLWSYTVF